MKLSANDWDENSMDALFFQYLEGELSVEKAKELEKKIASDPLLQSELKSWKASFIEEPFYDTKSLEKSLLKGKKKPVSPSGTVSVFIIALLTSLFSFLPLSEEKESKNNLVPVQIYNDSEEKKQEESMPAVRSIIKHHISAKKAQQEFIVEKASVEPPVPLFIAIEELSIIQVIPLESTPEAISLEKNSHKPSSALSKKQPAEVKEKTTTARTITRKRQRQIERRKERALQKRMADRFLKGRRPYSVPLNTKNF